MQHDVLLARTPDPGSRLPRKKPGSRIGGVPPRFACVAPASGARTRCRL